VVTKLITYSAALLLALGTSSAVAQESAWFVGAGVGQSKIKDFCDGFVGACDDSDTSWKIFGGYQWNRYFGVEAAYVDFGKGTANGSLLGVSVAGFSAKAWGLSAQAVGTLPIGDQFGLFGKLGLAYSKADLSGTVAGIPISTDDDDFGLTFGFGAKFNFTRNWGMRVEWERFQDVGGFDDDVDLISVGVVYTF
jgi:OOP family OmpA-OmpF porin